MQCSFDTLYQPNHLGTCIDIPLLPRPKSQILRFHCSALSRCIACKWDNLYTPSHSYRTSFHYTILCTCGKRIPCLLAGMQQGSLHSFHHTRKRRPCPRCNECRPTAPLQREKVRLSITGRSFPHSCHHAVRSR